MEAIKFDFNFNNLPDNLNYYYCIDNDIYVLTNPDTNEVYYVYPDKNNEPEINCENKESIKKGKIKQIDVDNYEIIELDSKPVSEILTIKDLKTSDYLYKLNNTNSLEQEFELKIEEISDKLIYTINCI